MIIRGTRHATPTAESLKQGQGHAVRSLMWVVEIDSLMWVGEIDDQLLALDIRSEALPAPVNKIEAGRIRKLFEHHGGTTDEGACRCLSN
jgi:hypothetical protein